MRCGKMEPKTDKEERQEIFVFLTTESTIWYNYKTHNFYCTHCNEEAHLSPLINHKDDCRLVYMESLMEKHGIGWTVKK